MYTFVVIGCERDLALLELQAQSFDLYLKEGQDILLLVNEVDSYNFMQGFENFRHYYKKFNLTIKTLSDFDFTGGQPYVDQQILKLAAAELTDNHLLVLDCQNFLCKPYVELLVFDDKIPYRNSGYAMDPRIWDQYCEQLNVNFPINLHNMCLSTPIYMHNKVIRSMIDHLGGKDWHNNIFGNLKRFAQWFYTATHSKSEFALYLQWCEKNQGLQHYHYLESDFHEWAGPYLRDHPQFDIEFNYYILDLQKKLEYNGVKNSDLTIRDFKRKWCWSSVNHRAWGDMTDEQFNRLTNILNGVKLNTDCLKSYRKNYVHLPI